MDEEENIKGNRVSIQWDKEKGKDWIILKDCSGKEIMRLEKELWDFDLQFRDNILTTCRRMYG